jgi:GNAT superfamily N-acetyltransferase
MEVSPVAQAHEQSVVELWHEAGLTRLWNDPVEDLRRALGGPTSAVLAGLEDDALLASAMVGHDGHRGWAYHLAVRPDVRGHGHGRAIMSACKVWLRERNVPKLNLMIRADNAEARAFTRRSATARTTCWCCHRD